MRLFQGVDPRLIGLPPGAFVIVAAEEVIVWFDAHFIQDGNIGTVAVLTLGNWRLNAAVFDDGAQEGGSFSLGDIPASWDGAVIETFFHWVNRTVNSGNIRVRLDVGPRASSDALGAQNDVNSPRIEATLAALGQDLYNRQSIGTFTFTAGKTALLGEISRLGADAADTLAASAYCIGLELRKQ